MTFSPAQLVENLRLDKGKVEKTVVTFPAVTAATATIATTANIVLTKATTSLSHNTNTYTIQVLAAAANPTNTILAAWTGTAAATTVTITPNDGTNNAATPVNLTTANLVELINTGSVTGKTVTKTDLSSLRILATATGGGAQSLADGGEGDGLAGTFAGATTSQAVYVTFYCAGRSVSVWVDIDASGVVPTGALYVAADYKIKVSATSGMSAVQLATAAYNAILASSDGERLFEVDDNLDGSLSVYNDVSGNVTNALPKKSDDTGAGEITVVVTDGRDGVVDQSLSPESIPVVPVVLS